MSSPVIGKAYKDGGAWTFDCSYFEFSEGTFIVREERNILLDGVRVKAFEVEGNHETLGNFGCGRTPIHEKKN